MESKVIAKAILSLSQPEVGDTVSNLKLQKLMYYVQGFNLAVFKKPLFEEKIIAWQYGPVVKEVYEEYKSSGSLGIPLDEQIDLKKAFKNNEQLELFLEVNKIYGQFSAVRLMNMTHAESPWKTTCINFEISHKKMRDFFSSRLVSK